MYFAYLKEIETTFLTQEGNEHLFEEKVKENENKEEKEGKEDKKVYIDVDIEIENEIENVVKEEKVNTEEEKESENTEISKEINNIETEERKVEEKNIDNMKEEKIEEIEEIKETKKSLLKSVFSNKRIKEEVSWKLHCVKDETSYEQIASKYGVNLNNLVTINKNEKLVEGKLIFLPLE